MRLYEVDEGHMNNAPAKSSSSGAITTIEIHFSPSLLLRPIPHTKIDGYKAKNPLFSVKQIRINRDKIA